MKTDPAVQTTLQKVADYFNTRKIVVAGPATYGFFFTLSTGLTKSPVIKFDAVAVAYRKAMRNNGLASSDSIGVMY